MLDKKRSKPSAFDKQENKTETKKTWILIAQRAKAKLMEHKTSDKKLSLVQGFVNPTGEMQTRELVSDKPGRKYRSGVGLSRSGTESSESAHEHSLTLFAKDLASTIEKGIARGDCDRVIIAAEPHCLGKIKKTLSSQALKRVCSTVNKDLFLLDDRKLYEKLEDTLLGA